MDGVPVADSRSLHSSVCDCDARGFRRFVQSQSWNGMAGELGQRFIPAVVCQECVSQLAPAPELCEKKWTAVDNGHRGHVWK